MARWTQHVLKLALALLLAIAGVIGFAVLQIRVPSGADNQDARESLLTLRTACPTLSEKTCYYSPRVSGPVLTVYGVVSESELDEIEAAAKRVLPRTRGTRVILKFYSSEVIHTQSNGAARRGTEELLREVVIR